MRFDDSLKTVLSADMATGFGAQSAWRQLVDLMGRGRIPVDEPAVARLRLLRQAVPSPVRAASARALAFAQPPAALVGFFAEDELAIGAPVLRTATLASDDWLALLARLTPSGRSVLRHRRDLPPEVSRGLESFGSTDFVLDHDAPPVEAAAPTPEPPTPALSPPAPDTPLSESPFVALGEVARGLPMVAAALRQAQDVPAADTVTPRFEIADLVARIDAFNSQRSADPAPLRTPVADPVGFGFETDAAGVIRWVDGVARGGLIGASIAYAAVQGVVQFDGIATGAYRRRSPFRDARLQVGGTSEAAGSWRLSAMPVFDRASGRFTGFRGSARRPRRDETTEPRDTARTATSDSLRQLVHELRTPANAVAGFAELIETQLLGPVPDPYRARAGTIRSLAGDLLAAIDDLDTAARIDGGTLDLRPAVVPLSPLMTRIVADLGPLAALRGATIVLEPASEAIDVAADDRATERLLARLAATLVSAAERGERIGIAAMRADGRVAIRLDRPRALQRVNDTSTLSIDSGPDADHEGAPLLGTGFALRLARNLAVQLGGDLEFRADRLMLHLPAAEPRRQDQATTI